LICTASWSQKKVFTVAFYNVENLFDTIDQADVWDDDRTPSGRYGNTKEVYNSKLNQIAKVISEIGKDEVGQSPLLLGLAEVENFGVVYDLTQTEYLKQQGYSIIHGDSPDKRGIDVALVYKNSSFFPSDFDFHELKIYGEDGQRIFTRDILEVRGYALGKPLVIFVNHWPSRRRGKLRSERLRIAASRLLIKKVALAQKELPEVQVILMGDFNDDPESLSIKTLSDSIPVLHNPYKRLAKMGVHSLVYRDARNLFDQIILSRDFLEEGNTALRLESAKIFNPPELTLPDGRFKGYPFRSYSFTNYTGGFSDHYPAYLILSVTNFEQ
jgi:predicted extracellular nuclease